MPLQLLGVAAPGLGVMIPRSPTGSATPASASREWSPLLLFLGAAAALLALFLVLEAAGIGSLLAPDAWARRADPATALLSFVLLLSDVVLPVPSSLVMAANGALFDLGPGAALSTAGGFASSMLAFAIGRKMAGGASEGAGRGHRILQRWGTVAVLLSRPVPLLAETVAWVAGATRFPVSRFALGSLLGVTPAAVIYAALGAAAVRGEPMLPLVAAYLALALAAALVGKAADARRAGQRSPDRSV